MKRKVLRVPRMAIVEFLSLYLLKERTKYMIHSSKIALGTILFSLILVSCGNRSTQQEEEKTKIVGEGSISTTQENENKEPIVDTLHVATSEVDNVFTYELGVELFRKFKASSIAYTTREMVNPHNELVDLIYSFETEGAKYDFLEVNDRQRVFLLSAEAKWSETRANTLTGMKERIMELVNSVQYEGDKTPEVICYSNLEEYADIYVSYTGKEISSYMLVNWVD